MSKAAIVTGGGRRVGAAISLGLAASGYDIFLHYNNSSTGAHDVKNKIEGEYSRRCIVFRADLMDFSACAEIISEAFASFSHCNLLVNNASIFHRLRFTDTTWRSLEENMRMHVLAPSELSKHFALRCSGEGWIINMIDRRVRDDISQLFSYALSKKSLLYMTEYINKELSPRIRAHAICPGVIMPDPNCPNLIVDCAVREVIAEILAVVGIQSKN